MEEESSFNYTEEYSQELNCLSVSTETECNQCNIEISSSAEESEYFAQETSLCVEGAQGATRCAKGAAKGCDLCYLEIVLLLCYFLCSLAVLRWCGVV